MSFTYGQYGDDRYLVYQFGEEDVLETMSFGQITNNAIDGLAPATFSQMDTTRSMMYKITSRMPLENFLQNPIRKNDLLKIISGIVRALRSVQEYMIDPGMLLLDKKYMFLRVSNFDLHMICLPVENSPYGGTRLQDFLWQLVARTEKDKSESREYVAEMMERLDTDEPLSLDEIDEMVAEFSQKGAQREPAYKPAPVAEPKPAPAPAPAPVKPAPQPYKPSPQPFKPAPQPAPQPYKPAPQPAPQPKPAPQPAPQPPKPAPQPYKSVDNPKPASQPYRLTADSPKPVSMPFPQRQDITTQFGPGYNPLNTEEEKEGGFFSNLFKKSEKPEKPKKEPKQKRSDRNSADELSFGSIPGGFGGADSNDQDAFGFAIPGSEKPAAQANPFAVPNAGAPEQSVEEPKPRRPMGGKKEKPVPAPAPAPTPAPARQPVSTWGDGTVLLQDGGDGTMLEEPSYVAPAEVKRNVHLLRESNNEIIRLKGNNFRIGSNFDYNDYPVTNNRTVGDTHAIITVSNNEYYIEDINSRNHTYVDDKVIPSMVKVKLENGSRVRLGTEKFVFRLY